MKSLGFYLENSKSNLTTFNEKTALSKPITVNGRFTLLYKSYSTIKPSIRISSKWTIVSHGDSRNKVHGDNLNPLINKGINRMCGPRVYVVMG